MNWASVVLALENMIICREKDEVREEEADLCAAYLERHFPHGSFQSSSQALG